MSERIKTYTPGVALEICKLSSMHLGVCEYMRSRYSNFSEIKDSISNYVSMYNFWTSVPIDYKDTERIVRTMEIRIEKLNNILCQM